MAASSPDLSEHQAISGRLVITTKQVDRILVEKPKFFRSANRTIDTKRTVCYIEFAPKEGKTTEKGHIGRWDRERPPQAAPKGNAEALRQKDRFRTILRKGRAATPDHRRCNSPEREGNLSGNSTGAQSWQMAALCLFCCQKRNDFEGGQNV